MSEAVSRMFEVIKIEHGDCCDCIAITLDGIDGEAIDDRVYDKSIVEVLVKHSSMFFVGQKVRMTLEHMGKTEP